MITIYRLFDDEGNCYVGSTAKNPWVRLMEHRQGYKQNNASVSSYKLFAMGNDIKMECLELCYPEERSEYEAYWIRQYKEKSVNKYLMEEIDYDNYQKNYQKKNWAKLNEQVECECGRSVSRKNISGHKRRPVHKILMAKKSN